MAGTFLGVDIGCESLKVVELVSDDDGLRWTRRVVAVHHNDVQRCLAELLGDWRWDRVASAGACGRLGHLLDLPRVPTEQTRTLGYRFLVSDEPVTILSMSGGGCSALELRPPAPHVLREAPRCAHGTGRFLRQLVGRFDLDVEQASALCEQVQDPAQLSSRCAVMSKSDMVYLASKGERRERILAGLFDAVCNNALALVHPTRSAKRLMLVGGVTRSMRVRDRIASALSRDGIVPLPWSEEHATFIDALGSAVAASRRVTPPPPLERLFAPMTPSAFDAIPAPRAYVGKVRRLSPRVPVPGDARWVSCVLGYDIGSTGAKAVAMDVSTRDVRWEGHVPTHGDPIMAAQELTRMFLEKTGGELHVVATGATGSGREIVGVLLRSCFGAQSVHVLNEIAAIALGAAYYVPEVDTVFEIGGQDAKYIRLAGGRIIDAAMNEACSAGTGSFIEEQGRSFSGMDGVDQLADEAMQATAAVSLGQHCSAFMADVIDEAVRRGVDRRAIIAGIYDSIIQNYLSRVKGARPVGRVIVCQGMPFVADALAAAVVRHVGVEVIVPASPGTVGAVGIALATVDDIDADGRSPLDIARFLKAHVDRKESFVCKSNAACSASGRACRIESIWTVSTGARRHFTWGGCCSLHDGAKERRGLASDAPDPFLARARSLRRLLDEVQASGGAKTVALAGTSFLEPLLPFLATFISHLGFRTQVIDAADRGALDRAKVSANVSFCAPMRLYHGAVEKMLDGQPDVLVLPMLRSLPRVRGEAHATLCPIGEASSDILRWDLRDRLAPTVVSPMIDMGPSGLESPEFERACRRLARDLDVHSADAWRHAFDVALAAQRQFESCCLDFGKEALEYCAAHDIVPVIVLGRPYTVHDPLLNANAPALLREFGALAIPSDCYPIDPSVPVFRDIYWSHSQRTLRAAHQVRRTPGVYSLFCANHACGPDSFTSAFYTYTMQGKPSCIIETDGDCADTGAKTRVEAFLYCVEQDRRSSRKRERPRDLRLIELDKETVFDVIRREELLLVPRMGTSTEAIAAALRGLGVHAESLPMPDRESLYIGRRHTSGKECLPVVITVGSLLQRLEKSRDSEERFALLMPIDKGPCRFGAYNLLHKIVLEQQGWKERVRVWSPAADSGYFDDLAPGFAALIFSGIMCMDLIVDMLHDVRPVEAERGATDALFLKYKAELLSLLEEQGGGDLSLSATLGALATQRLFGCLAFLRRAARDFARQKTRKKLPEVLLVGELYMRFEPFANDFIVDKLEGRGVRVRLAPFNEWLEYSTFLNLKGFAGKRPLLDDRVRGWIQSRIQAMAYRAVAPALGWPPRTSIHRPRRAAHSYLRSEFNGEAVMMLGRSVLDWRRELIDGVVNVGPLECMHGKISQAQLFHAAEHERLPSLSLSFHGDPLNFDALDNFLCHVREHFSRKTQKWSRVAKQVLTQLKKGR